MRFRLLCSQSIVDQVLALARATVVRLAPAGDGARDGVTAAAQAAAAAMVIVGN